MQTTVRKHSNDFWTDKARFVERVTIYSKTTMQYYTRMTSASLVAKYGNISKSVRNSEKKSITKSLSVFDLMWNDDLNVKIILFEAYWYSITFK